MTFYSPAEEIADVSFMQRYADYSYFEKEGKFQAIRLPYGQFRPMEGHLALPHFSMEYEKTLNEVLKAMGLGIAFDDSRADFLDMVVRDEGPRLFISKVKHKSFIEVDEKGTEAAAVTSVEIRVESAPLQEPFQMNVNRPFFFLIHDGETNEILFTGTVEDPTK